MAHVVQVEFICFPLFSVDVPAWPTSRDALQYLGVWVLSFERSGQKWLTESVSPS